MKGICIGNRENTENNKLLQEKEIKVCLRYGVHVLASCL